MEYIPDYQVKFCLVYLPYFQINFFKQIDLPPPHPEPPGPEERHTGSLAKEGTGAGASRALGASRVWGAQSKAASSSLEAPRQGQVGLTLHPHLAEGRGSSPRLGPARLTGPSEEEAPQPQSIRETETAAY